MTEKTIIKASKINLSYKKRVRNFVTYVTLYFKSICTFYFNI